MANNCQFVWFELSNCLPLYHKVNTNYQKQQQNGTKSAYSPSTEDTRSRKES